MMIVDYWSNFQNWVYRHIGELGEVSLKHRSAVMLLAILMFFIEPSVKLTFGKASLAGFGTSLDPPQTFPIGLILLALLIYRLIAFWVSVLLESGTDSKRATRKALYDFEPAYDVEENQAYDMEQIIKSESNTIIYKWETRQILWQFFLPNLLALGSLVQYLIVYLR